MYRSGFTLIELLIVVAIIGILAAIAVPNFINAQVRAKLSRTMADLRMLKQQTDIFNMDTNLWLIDGNDGGPPECYFRTYQFIGKNPNHTSTKALQGINHFDGNIYLPLTTPVSYISSIPIDSFTDGLFYSYEDRGCSNNDGVFGQIAAAGPDGDSGDWHTQQGAVAYHPSNGLSSNGDIWYIWRFRPGWTSSTYQTYFNNRDGWSAQF